MRSVRRLLPRLLLGVVAGATLFAACQQAAPPEVTKPRRRSFEEAGNWRPTAPAAAPAAGGAGSSGGSVDAQARQVQTTWEQARHAKGDAERQRLANEALEKTRSMAEPPSGPQ